MRYDIKLNPETTLERHVATWLRAEARDREGSIKSVFGDLSHGGCASGMVGHLIWHSDTVRFFGRHRSDIEAIVSGLIADTGCQIGELLRDWDAEDPFVRDTHNKNLLAWFGFEAAARRLVESAE